MTLKIKCLICNKIFYDFYHRESLRQHLLDNHIDDILDEAIYTYGVEVND